MKRHWKNFARFQIRLATVVLIAAICSGCTTKPDKVPVLSNPGIGADAYPNIPSDLKTVVALPPDSEGDDVYLSRKKNRNALKVCRAEQTELIDFYQQLKKAKR
jgi:hypothetical protein